MVCGPEPHELWVCDFHLRCHVSTFRVREFIMTFARRVVGRRVSRSTDTELVLDALG